MHLHIWATTTLLFLIGSAFSNSVVDTAGENEASNLRIISGITAQTGQYPFMASVLSPRSACAGTLIAPSYVLTAAHCVSLPSSGNMMEMLNSKVFLNTLFVAGKAGTNSVTNYISKIIVHENYSVNGTGYDDEGGPIIVSGFQVGIASFFSKSNQCNDPKAPAVFTRVSAYASWIAKTMAKNPPPIPSI